MRKYHGTLKLAVYLHDLVKENMHIPYENVLLLYISLSLNVLHILYSTECPSLLTVMF